MKLFELLNMKYSPPAPKPIVRKASPRKPDTTFALTAQVDDDEDDYEEDFQDEESPKQTKEDDRYAKAPSPVRKANRFDTPGQMLDVSPPKMSNFSMHTAKKKY